MRKVTTIVAVAAAIIMLGAVAQAQTITPSTTMANGAISGDYIMGTGAGNWSIQAPNAGIARSITNFYMENTGNSVINLMGTQSLAVTNYYAVAGALNKTKQANANGALNISRYWLNVNSDLLFNEETGANKVTLRSNGIAIANGQSTAANGTNNFNVTQYGVSVATGTTLGALDMFGGNVNNNGTISNLLFGSGTYTGNGTVEELSFNVGSDVFDIVDLTITADEYNLDNANLYVNAGNTVFEDGAKIDFGFANAVVNGAFASIEIVGDEWAWLTGVLDAFGLYQNLDFGGNLYDVAFDKTGIAVSSAAVPEPATLAVLGLGLAGLGLARRRRK